MENIYEWLFDQYAEPQLRADPIFRPEMLQPLLRQVPKEDQLDWEDMLDSLRLDWCTAAFQLGVQLGIRLP